MPRLSHQFPVEVVVAVTVVELDGVEVDTIIVVLVAVVELVVVAVALAVVVEAIVLVDEEQDANTNDITMRKISDNEISPLFMYASYFINNSSKLT